MYALIKDNCIQVYESFLYRESLKEMPDAQWIPTDKAWTLPLQDSNLLSLKLLGCELRGDLVKQYTTLISNDIKPETQMLVPAQAGIEIANQKYETILHASTQLDVRI